MVAAIMAFPATLAALLGFVNGRKIDKVHDQGNSNLAALKAELKTARDELLQMTREQLAIAQGHADGIKEAEDKKP